MLRRIVAVMLMIFWLAAAYGCNTMHGMGKDIESLGESIKDASD